MFRMRGVLSASVQSALTTIYPCFQLSLRPQARSIQTITVGTIADAKERSAVAILKYTRSLPEQDESAEDYGKRNQQKFLQILSSHIHPEFLRPNSQVMLIIVNPSLARKMNDGRSYRVKGGHISCCIVELSATQLVVVPGTAISKTVKLALGQALKKRNAQLGGVTLIDQDFRGQVHYENDQRVLEHLLGTSPMSQVMSLQGSDTFCIAIPMALATVSTEDIIRNISEYTARNTIYDRQKSACGNAVLYAVSRDENGTMYTQEAAMESAVMLLPEAFHPHFFLLGQAIGLDDEPKNLYLGLSSTAVLPKKIHVDWKGKIHTTLPVKEEVPIIPRAPRLGW